MSNLYTKRKVTATNIQQLCTINTASHQQKHTSYTLQEIDMGGDAMSASTRLMFQLQQKIHGRS